MEDPAPLGLYLGCMHERTVRQVGNVRTVEISYNMQPLFEDCVAQYVKLTGYLKEFRRVPTPFLAGWAPILASLFGLVWFAIKIVFWFFDLSGVPADLAMFGGHLTRFWSSWL